MTNQKYKKYIENTNILEYEYSIPNYIYKNNIIDPEVEYYRLFILNNFFINIENKIKKKIKRELVNREKFKFKTYIGQLLISQLSLLTYGQPKEVIYQDSLIIKPSKTLLLDFYRDLNNLFKNKVLFKYDELDINNYFDKLIKNIKSYKIKLLSKQNNNPLTKFKKYSNDNEIVYKLVFKTSHNISNKFKLNKNVYERMKIMYSGPYKDFDLYVICGLIRYEALNSGGNQYVLNLEFKEQARQQYGLNFELFASMFNNYYDNFCSLFYDLEKYFGSKGSVFGLNIKSGLYFSNPPFVDSVMTKMYEIIKQFAGPKTMFIANMPKWEDYYLQELVDKEQLYKKKWLIYEKFLNPFTQKEVDIPPNYIYLFVDNNFVNKDMIVNISNFINKFYKNKIVTKKQYLKYIKNKEININLKKMNQLKQFTRKQKAGGKNKKSKLINKKNKQTKKQNKTKSKTVDSIILESDFLKLDYPYYSYFTDISKIKKDFQKLKNYKPQIITDYKTNKLESLIINGKKYKNYIIIEDYISNYYLHKITEYFSQYCRVLCEFRYKDGSRLSELQAFQKNKQDIYNNIKQQNNGNVTYLNTEDYMYMNYKRCTLFKTTVSLAILQLFKPKVWVDISCGWGDRLISAIAYGKCKYLGTDPSKCQQKNYKKIINTFVSENNRQNYKIQKIGYEENKYKKNSADLIWSGPPFFDLEIYEHTDNQSHQKYNTFYKWVNNFLYRDIIQKSVPILQKGGHLALYISDYAKYKYTMYIRNKVKNQIPELEYKGKIYYLDKNDKHKTYRYIHVWQKI